MTNKTLFISDMDGTLLNSNKEISVYTEDALNRLIAEGLNFSVATARTAASTVKILSRLNINQPIVLMNGVIIYDVAKASYIKKEIIPADTAGMVISVIKEYGISGFMYTLSGNNLVTYYENLDTKALKEFHDERVNKYYKSFELVDSFFEKLHSNEIIYFCMIDEYDTLLPVFNDMKKCSDIDLVMYKDIYDESMWYLEIFSINASKYNAVKFLREYCGYDYVVGFGDNYNDIPLFKACDEGYAVANAVNELKERASGVIDTNNNDGVARYIAGRYQPSVR